MKYIYRLILSSYLALAAVNIRGMEDSIIFANDKNETIEISLRELVKGFYCAINKGRIDFIKSFLELKLPIDICELKLITYAVNLLIYKVEPESILYKNILTIIEQLLQAGINSNQISEELRKTIILPDSLICEILIDSGAQPTLNVLDTIMRLALPEKTDRLMRKFLEKDLLNYALDQAIASDKTQLIDFLIGHGISISERQLKLAELYESSYALELLQKHLAESGN